MTRTTVWILCLLLLPACASIEPLRDLSAAELAYLEKLAVHLEKQKEEYNRAIKDITNLDADLARALNDRARSEMMMELHYRSLEADGFLPKHRGNRALWLAGYENMVEQQGIYERLSSARTSRKGEARILRELYASLTKAIEKASRNHKKVDEYLQKSWLSRRFYDTKGLDPDGLKNLSEQIETLRDQLASEGGS